MDRSTPATTRRTYFPELDGVRALAILLVMTFHLAQDGVHIPGPTIIGQTGVDLFFVLSGFLITGILLKAPQRDWHEIRTFYIRRSLRIFPLYYGTLLVLALFGSQLSSSFWYYTQNLYRIFPPGPNHFWSLAVEEQFYLVWPFMVLILPRRYIQHCLWALIAIAFLCRPFLIHWNFSPFTFTLSRVDTLAAGALIAVLQSTGRLLHYRKLLLYLFPFFAILVALEGIVSSHHPSMAWEQATKFSFVAGFYASGLALLLLRIWEPAARWLSIPPLRFIGRISYGLYVFHPFVFSWILPRMRGSAALVQIAVALIATFTVALISWYAFEVHFMKLKDKLAPERSAFPKSVNLETA